ncbi:MAG: hypothetical protein ABI415_00055 [Flavitalea sp.]
MIEVFKTDVDAAEDASMLTEHLHRTFTRYKVNFDLSDCDRVLRVCCPENVEPNAVIRFLKKFGFRAEVLPFVYSLIYLHN